MWERYPTVGISVTSAGSRPVWYFHTGLSALALRETQRAEHLLWMIDGGLAMKWSEGRGFVGVGMSLRFAGSFFAEAEEEEEGEDEEEESGGPWWWPIKDLEEFAASPQVYVRIPLVEDLALEASYVGVREKETMVGGLDVMLIFRFPQWQFSGGRGGEDDEHDGSVCGGLAVGGGACMRLRAAHGGNAGRFRRGRHEGGETRHGHEIRDGVYHELLDGVDGLRRPGALGWRFSELDEGKPSGTGGHTSDRAACSWRAADPGGLP
jgi:hypothetical protein